MNGNTTEIIQYRCYNIGSMRSNRLDRRVFCIEELDIRCARTHTVHKEYVQQYIDLLEKTNKYETNVESRGLELAELYQGTVVPRGGYILGMLVQEEEIDKTLIKKLLSAGATPCKEITTWACGQLAWLYLSEIVKEHEGRKMAKPACITHN